MNEHEIRKILEGGGGWPGRMLRAGLWIPGKCYGAAMRIRRAAYRMGLLESRKAAVPVISVGNLTAGGSGKTPFVAMLANRLAAKGRKPGIILRGYRASSDNISDEAAQYGELCPDALVEVGADRRASAARAVKAGADVVIMDDGFQHLRLRRDMDIVLVDATSPWGGGNAFPGGMLREPESALGAADAVIITRSDQASSEEVEKIRIRAAALAPRAPIFTARHRPARLRRLDGTEVGLEALKGRKVLALAGIARPEAFLATLAGLGAEVSGLMAGRDHDNFANGLVEKALARAKKEDLTLVITEKDRTKAIFSRLAGNAVDNSNVWSLGVEQEVEREKELLDLVFESALRNY